MSQNCKETSVLLYVKHEFHYFCGFDLKEECVNMCVNCHCTSETDFKRIENIGYEQWRKE